MRADADEHSVLTSVLDLLGKSPWPRSHLDLQALLNQLGFQQACRTDNREDWRKEDATAHLYAFPEQVTFLELVLSQDEANEDPASVPKRAREMRASYEAARDVARTRLGEPTFDGEFGDDGFPDDQDAVRLAVWQEAETRIMLQQKFDGPDFPMCVVCVIEPTGPAGVS